MKLPRDVYGTQLAKHLCKRWDFVVDHQTGSHIILITEIPDSGHVSIPAHKPIKVGTLASILDYVAAHKAVPAKTSSATSNSR